MTHDEWCPVSSAFPPLRYLCHLWPIRAAERMPLGDTYLSSNEDTQFLILLRDQDYWNYFAVSEELARLRWPAASVVGGLHYGVSPDAIHERGAVRLSVHGC